MFTNILQVSSIAVKAIVSFPGTSEIILINMGKTDWYKTLRQQNTINREQCSYFLGFTTVWRHPGSIDWGLFQLQCDQYIEVHVLIDVLNPDMIPAGD